MAQLKLRTIEDYKPVKLTFDLPAQVYRDLVAYAEVLALESGASPIDPARLIAPMLTRFMSTDREFAKRRRRAAARPSSPDRG